MIDWHIQSRAHACQACGQAFAHQQPYHTLLFDARHAYERLDVCEQCWTDQYSQGASDRKGFISHWQGVYQTPPPPPPEPIRKETAETLLRKLVALQQPQHAAACYILAVMLERKRLLKVKAQADEDGCRTFIYEHAKTGDLFRIGDPQLQLNQLDAVQRDLARLLQHGLSPPAAADPTPETPPVDPATERDNPGAAEPPGTPPAPPATGA